MADRASKIKGLGWVALAFILAVLFAVGIGPLAHVIPWSWEKRLGNILTLDVGDRGCRRNPAADALLRRMVGRVYPLGPDDKGFTIEVEVVKDPAVNAYAGLGGKIKLNTGLLKEAESPEEVAGVLAHEIEHVHHRHIMEGALVHFFTVDGINLIFGNSTSTAVFARYLVNMDFTRSQETQADEEGLCRLQKARVDNRGFRDFFERMEKEKGASTFLSDHPSNRARIEMAERFKTQDPQPIMTKAEWGILKDYCGGR